MKNELITMKKKKVLGTLCQELTCPGCGKLYNNSYLLPCEHSLCDSCLGKEIKHEKGGQICVKCPLCKESFRFNQEDEIKFPKNYLLNSTVTRYKQERPNTCAKSIKKNKQKIKGKINPQPMQILCQLCDEKNSHLAMKKCVNCNLNFCEKCLRKIHKNKAFLSHVLIDPSSCTEDQIKCFFHPFTNLRHYCIQDKTPICDECKFSNHRNHRLYSLDLAFQCEIAEMQNNVSQFAKVKANFEKCIQQLKLMKTDMEQNEIQQNAEVIKEFTTLHEALILQEQAIKEMIKTETTKKQTEVDNFVESASTLMLQLEGLMLYAIEACKESKPAVFLQTSAQINKRLSEIMLCVIPSSSLAIIPFEGFELNVDHIKGEIDALPSQLCENELKHSCSGDFQMVQNLNIPCEVKKLKANCSEQEPFLNRHCPSFTSKAHATLVTHNSDSCLCIPRSCAGNFSSNGSKEDSFTDDLHSLQYSPQHASEDSCSTASTKTATNGHISQENSQSIFNDETTSNAIDGNSYANMNSSKSNEKSASNLDPASDASCLDYCESVTNSDHCVPHDNSETQALTNHTLSSTNSCKSDPRTSNIFQGACFKSYECMNTNCTLSIPVGIDLSSNVLNVPIKAENNDANQEFNPCQRKPKMAKPMYVSEKTLEIPKRWWKMHNCNVRHSSGDAFSIELGQKGANTSNDKCSLEPENNKYPNNLDSGDLSKDDMSNVISEQVPDSDTGICSSYNSSCLSSERETNECVAPLYQPCTFTHTGLAQASYTNGVSEDFFNGEKNIPLSICNNDSLSQSEKSNDSCNIVSYVHPHYTTGSNLSCKDMNLTTERKSSEMITDDCQLCQLSSSAGCKIECSKEGTPCLLATASHKAEHACFDNVDMCNHLRYWNTSSILHNIVSRCKSGGQPAFRNPKLLSKSKTFIQSNPKIQTSGTAQINPSHSTAHFDVNLNMSDRDFSRNKALHFPKCTINYGAKGHSDIHPFSTDFPKSQTFRNVHRNCSQLKPHNGICITTCQKNQENACTLEKQVSENQGTKNLPSLLKIQNVALECDVGKIHLSDNHVQFDLEDGAWTQIYEQLHATSLPKEPMNASDELPGPPEIYKHTVKGTSAKVEWMCPPLGKQTAYFFELQFQEIISIDKEMAIPRVQAGVFSGIKHKNFVATNLNSNSEYLFRVRAVNMTGKGPWSQPYKVKFSQAIRSMSIDKSDGLVKEVVPEPVGPALNATISFARRKQLKQFVAAVAGVPDDPSGPLYAPAAANVTNRGKFRSTDSLSCPHHSWSERYYINDTFYLPGGPVFLMIGGEGTANPAWMDHGAWITFAEKLGALCLLIEHRFYGKSQPMVDLSLSSLQYLHSKQALADLAHFRSVIDIKMNLTLSKWIAFGGSYPGSLAAWFRLKYPHLVYAAIASSAPVQAVINFSEYLEVVNYALESYSTACPLLVKDATDTLIGLLPNTAKYHQITHDFQLCDPLEVKSGMDSAYLLETLAGNFMDVVQYNKDNRLFEDPKGANITIDKLCTIMENSSLGIPYKRYAKVSQLLLDTYEEKCLDASYSKFLSDMLNTSWAAPAADGSRQWAYQSCTEFGYYQSTESLQQPFAGFPLSYKLQQCMDLFGPVFNRTVLADAVQHTNENYGGTNIKGSRIVFPNGSMDPWHVLSITKGRRAIYIQGTAHCADMYPLQQSDLPQLREARNEIFRRLKTWVKQ